VDIVGPLFEQVPLLAMLAGNEVLLGLTFLTVTAAVFASGTPGALLPISFSSGVLLGGWLGVAVVAAGAVLGSQLLFLATRRWLAARLRQRFGARLARMDREIGKRGFVYLIGLRLVGVPHLPVTAASALSPLPARNFALATTLGLLPAITLAALAGSAV
jgi:uncharacterized membrane protein YdjX (TVP38/TMEM64 family)